MPNRFVTTLTIALLLPASAFAQGKAPGGTAALNRDQGITVVMVTHETDIAAYARRVLRFVDGRLESDQRSKQAA